MRGDACSQVLLKTRPPWSDSRGTVDLYLPLRKNGRRRRKRVSQERNVGLPPERLGPAKGSMEREFLSRRGGKSRVSKKCRGGFVKDLAAGVPDCVRNRGGCRAHRARWTVTIEGEEKKTVLLPGGAGSGEERRNRTAKSVRIR